MGVMGGRTSLAYDGMVQGQVTRLILLLCSL
eukprot:COSAG05_NODE_15467_length_369_cov_0.574074_1_plen_30_part_10